MAEPGGGEAAVWSSVGEVAGVECTVMAMLSLSALAYTQQSTKAHRSALRTNARGLKAVRNCNGAAGARTS
jgi:hypothetical protein